MKKSLPLLVSVFFLICCGRVCANSQALPLELHEGQLMLNIKNVWIPITGITHVGGNLFEVFEERNDKVSLRWQCRFCDAMNDAWESRCWNCGRTYWE